MNRQDPRAQSGFTLIEVLVALAILGISLAVLLHIFSESLHRARESQAEMTASALAQSLLADAGHSLPLRPGDTTGELPNGYSWRLHIEPYGSDEDRKSWQMGAVAISASVSWNDGGQRRSMTLTTLRAVPKEPGQ
jgi:general secretion pathway protein I